jgi:catechol 2,3-dioxygenase-like lactoylglutathione lyase family enzyme
MISGSPVIDHVLLIVSSYEASRRLYQAALEPLGFRLLYEEESGGSFGVEGHDDFGVYEGRSPSARAHVAFVASDRSTVDAFYQAALANGARDNGAPGIRSQYHVGYYAAYVLDPDGNNIEAVHHDRS